MFAGAAREPITAVLIVVELTGECSLILLLVAAVVLATGISHLLSRACGAHRRPGLDPDAYPRDPTGRRRPVEARPAGDGEDTRVTAYLSLALVLGVAVVAVLVAVLVHRRSSVAPSPLPTTAFLSGWHPAEHALARFEARFYPLTLLFLAFDVEMLYMYPWATVVAQVGLSAVIEMFVLLGVLMVGVLWAWREGALRWT